MLFTFSSRSPLTVPVWLKTWGLEVRDPGLAPCVGANWNDRDKDMFI